MNRIPVTLLLALVASPWSAFAAPVDVVTTGQFQVEIKGKADPTGKVYRSTEQPLVLLVTTSAFSRPIYITTGPMSARLLDPGKVTSDPATPEHRKVDPSGAVEDILTMKPDGANLTLEKDGISVTLAPPPPVLGDRTLEELTAQLPDYRRDAMNYAPKASAIETLQQLKQPAEVLVFFGSWCSHCAEHVPRLVRTLQDAKSAKLHVTFHGVPPNGGGDAMADSLRISALPTMIVRRDGKEIARLTDTAWDTPEVSLANALSGKSAKP